MFEYVERVGTVLRSMATDPATMSMLMGIVCAIGGAVAKPVSVWSWRTASWGAKKTGHGIKWCFVTPEPGPEVRRLLVRLESNTAWLVKGDDIIFHPDGDSIDLGKRTYRRHGIDVTSRFTRSERKAVLRGANEVLRRLIASAQDYAMAKL
jgi:hypothetical protein